MKTAKALAVCTVLFLLLYSASSVTEGGIGSAFGSAFSGPYSSIPHVRLEGVFCAHEGDAGTKGPHNRLYLSIRGQEKLFLAYDVLNLTGTGRGFGVLSRINSNRVAPVGPDDLLEKLNMFATSERPLVIEGRLYFSSGRLLVTKVEEDPGKIVSD